MFGHILQSTHTSCPAGIKSTQSLVAVLVLHMQRPGPTEAEKLRIAALEYLLTVPQPFRGGAAQALRDLTTATGLQLSSDGLPTCGHIARYIIEHCAPMSTTVATCKEDRSPEYHDVVKAHGADLLKEITKALHVNMGRAVHGKLDQWAVILPRLLKVCERLRCVLWSMESFGCYRKKPVFCVRLRGSRSCQRTIAWWSMSSVKTNCLLESRLPCSIN